MDKVHVALTLVAAVTVGGLVGCIAGAAVFDWRRRQWRGRKPVPAPPQVAGALAPDRPAGIDFARPHDFHFSRAGWRGAGGDELLVFRSCILEGFTSPVRNGEAGVRDAGLTGRPLWSTPNESWVVLRQPDGRHVYAPAQALVYVVESEVAGSGIGTA